MRAFTTIARAASRCNVPGVYVCARSYVHIRSGFSALEMRDQGYMRELDIQTAYQTLRQIALGGNRTRTQACVNILITERDEKPNVKLYDALLLANVDHQNGSASEISDLLEEMANEGFTPTSATYHAVLKVENLEFIQC